MQHAAAMGFWGNVACAAFMLLSSVFAMCVSAKKAIECQRSFQCFGCLPCCVQLAIIIVVPIFTFSDQAAFCAGEVAIVPGTTTVAYTNVLLE